MFNNISWWVSKYIRILLLFNNSKAPSTNTAPCCVPTAGTIRTSSAWAWVWTLWSMWKLDQTRQAASTSCSGVNPHQYKLHRLLQCSVMHCGFAFPVAVSLKNTFASLPSRYACGWVRLTGKQSTRENNGVDGVTYVLWRHEGDVGRKKLRIIVSTQTVSINQPTQWCFATLALANSQVRQRWRRWVQPSGWVYLTGKQNTQE